MPSKNMLPKGKRRQTVKPAYRAHRQAQRDADEAEGLRGGEASPADYAPGELVAEAEAGPQPTSEVAETPDFEMEDGVRSFVAEAGAEGKRLDAYLAKALRDVSRARVQLLIDQGQVRVNGSVEKASYKLSGGERLEIEGEPQPAPLRAEPEDIPLQVVYEDEDLAVIDKAAGMTVHAGAGDAEHNRGTLVNALLFHFGRNLSGVSGAKDEPEVSGVRPGIVHRLDKETSGLIMVAKNNRTHRRLSEMFAARAVEKTYLALVHGSVAREEGTVDLPIGRDPVRRTRMTARRSVEAGARPAVSHWRVLERIGSRERPGVLGAFTLLEVGIETGRTHQIRVHLAALGHPVVGDTLYGAPGRLHPGLGSPKQRKRDGSEAEPTLTRNFLHAAELRLRHPRTGVPLDLRAPLPVELEAFLREVRGPGDEPGAAARA